MPILNNETLDDPPIHDETIAFNGGVYSSARRNQLATNMLAAGINVMIEKDGQLVTRRGSAQIGNELVAGAITDEGDDAITDETGAAMIDETGGGDGWRVLGMAYLDTPALEWLVRVVRGAAAARVEKHGATPGDAWVTVTGFAPDNDAPVEIIPALDKLFFLNGVDRMRTWDGTSWVTAGATTSDAPLASLAEWFQYRLFAAGVAAKPDTVFFCDVLDASDGHWSHTAKSFRVGAGEGDPIRGLRRWVGSTLAVLKRSSLWLADVNPTITLGSEVTQDCVHDSIGCVAGRTVRRVGTDLFFLSDDGVRSMQQSIADKATNQVTPPISDPVKDIFQRINEDAAHTACAEAFNIRYLIAIPIDGATQPNVVLSYNTLFKVWEGYWTGPLPTVFVRSYFGGQQRLNWGQSDGRAMQWRNWVRPAAEAQSDFTDAGVIIPTTIGLRSHNFGEPKNDKKGVVLELEFDASQTPAVAVKAYRDEAEDGEALATVTSGLNAGLSFPLTLPFTIAKPGIKREQIALDDIEPFRELSIELTAAEGKVAFRNARLTAWLETMPMGKA